MKITLQQLKYFDACSVQVVKFEELFGSEVEVTEKLCLSVAGIFDWDWVARHFLNKSALAVYDKTRESAWAVYDKTRESAWAVYDKTCESAWAVYDKTCEPARAVYDKTCESAQAVYDKTCESALAVYDKTCASAFGKLAEKS